MSKWFGLWYCPSVTCVFLSHLYAFVGPFPWQFRWQYRNPHLDFIEQKGQLLVAVWFHFFCSASSALSSLPCFKWWISVSNLDHKTQLRYYYCHFLLPKPVLVTGGCRRRGHLQWSGQTARLRLEVAVSEVVCIHGVSLKVWWFWCLYSVDSVSVHLVVFGFRQRGKVCSRHDSFIVKSVVWRLAVGYCDQTSHW